MGKKSNKIHKIEMMSDTKYKITNHLTIYKINSRYMLYHKKNDIQTNLYDNLKTIGYKFFILYNNGNTNGDIYNLELELIHQGDINHIPNTKLWESIYKYKGE